MNLLTANIQRQSTTSIQQNNTGTIRGKLNVEYNIVVVKVSTAFESTKVLSNDTTTTWLLNTWSNANDPVIIETVSLHNIILTTFSLAVVIVETKEVHAGYISFVIDQVFGVSLCPFHNSSTRDDNTMCIVIVIVIRAVEAEVSCAGLYLELNLVRIVHFTIVPVFTLSTRLQLTAKDIAIITLITCIVIIYMISVILTSSTIEEIHICLTTSR